MPPVEPTEHVASARVAVLIPARYESSRFPGKPLVSIAGRPMIEHVYRRAAAAAGVDRVLVATDDDRIRRAVEGFGGEAVMTRADHQSGTDRLAEVAAGLDCELVVNVQGDEPLVHPETIAGAVAAFRDRPGLQMSTVRTALDEDEYRDPNVVKVVVDAEGYALYFSRAPIPYSRPAAAAAPPAAASKHMGLYVYRRPFLLALARLTPTPLECAERLEQLRALEHGFRILTVATPHVFVGVDTPADVARAERALDAAGSSFAVRSP